MSPNSRFPHRRVHSGFTLIEVLIALLVFALIATAASEVGSQYINSYERIRDKTLAAWIAENRMNELRLSPDFPGTGENSSELDYGQYRWRVISEVIGTEEPTIRRVEVTVERFMGTGNEARPVHTLSGFIGELGR